MIPDELGRTYKDTITGFKGIAVVCSAHINGSKQLLLSPPVNDMGEMQSAYWFDIERLVQTDDQKVSLIPAGINFDSLALKDK